MKYAIFSDIHGNSEALETVLAAMAEEQPDIYLCAGDIVGYGANPRECITKIQELGPAIICGNHDWAACGLVDIAYFNPYAKRAILWTAEQLDGESKRYLTSLPLTHKNRTITMVHGTLDDPERFSYVLDGYTAARTMALMQTPICFIGHSHVAGIFCERKGTVSYRADGKVRIRSAEKYIVNVGSVGQPRDGDPRASYCIYDSERETVEIRRVPYDVPRAQQKIIDAGLPEILAARLSEGR